MLKIFGTIALIIVASIGGKSAQAEYLGLPALKFDPSRVYLAFVADRGIPFNIALFCPVRSGVYQSCHRKQGYQHGDSVLSRGTYRTNPNIAFTSVPFIGTGRFALFGGSHGYRRIVPKSVTYYFDARPGTVFVLGAPGRDAKQSVAQARVILVEQFGEPFGQLSYVHMSAAKTTCTDDKPRNSRKCTLGKQVDLKSVGKF